MTHVPDWMSLGHPVRAEQIKRDLRNMERERRTGGRAYRTIEANNLLIGQVCERGEI